LAVRHRMPSLVYVVKYDNDCQGLRPLRRLSARAEAADQGKMKRRREEVIREHQE
jgi:hypothetical protein